LFVVLINKKKKFCSLKCAYIGRDISKNWDFERCEKISNAKKEYWKNPENLKNHSIEMKNRYLNDKYYENHVNKIIESWSNDENRKYMQSISFAKEKNPMWNGGSSRGIAYNYEFTHKLKNRIRDRDLHKCQICKIDESSLKDSLYVHHIDYNKKNSSENNLISLCDSCHSKTNYNRSTWIEYFKKLEKEWLENRFLGRENEFEETI
jgi:5-methylcytosine-specific restriction endonuclease McrA